MSEEFNLKEFKKGTKRKGKNISIYMDTDLYEILKKKKINISCFVNFLVRHKLVGDKLLK